MEIILSIIALVAMVCLYDYFSAKNWQQVTSSVRNDLVFEKRNKAYGAYQMRKNYDKQMLLIIGGLIVGMGGAFAAYFAVNEAPKTTLAIHPPTESWDTTILVLNLKDEVIPDIQTDKDPSTQQTVENPEIVVVDDLPSDVPPIADGDIAIADKKQEGTGTGDFPIHLPVDVLENVLPPAITEPYTDVDISPSFPNMPLYLGKNLRYPELPQEMGVQGKCYIQFVVTKEGKVSNIKVVRGVDGYPEFEKEAMRVIKKMGTWKPGIVKGKPVDSYFQLPINFTLD